MKSSKSPEPSPSQPGAEGAQSDSTYFGREYLVALQLNHPEFFGPGAEPSVDRRLHIGPVGRWLEHFDTVGVDAPDRFQPLPDRPWRSKRSAWDASGAGVDARYAGVHYSYKGLINLKPATDLVLYNNLIWELQPRTILEFGSMQGGSGLWLADQLDAMCGHGEVHSFELCFDCISPRALHPRLHFHQADLRDLSTLNADLLSQLPHPWLVIDDAHESVDSVARFIAGFMGAGDYYVIEDIFLLHPAREGKSYGAISSDMVVRVAEVCHSLGFVVDTKYTDAFGLNVTTSPNGWLVKQEVKACGPRPAQ